MLPWIRIDLDVHSRPHAHELQILFKDLPLDPDRREVCDTEQPHAWHNTLPLDNGLFQNNARDRRN